MVGIVIAILFRRSGFVGVALTSIFYQGVQNFDIEERQESMNKK